MPSANARWYKVGDALVVLSQGDITQWSGDALVNAGQRGDRVLAFACEDRKIHPRSHHRSNRIPVQDAFGPPLGPV
jgi:hypothetical protein